MFLTTNPRRSTSTGVFGGVTGNRTRDTRIFSPLLYQLSYDTIVSFGIAKIRTFSVYPNFSSVFSAESIFLICI